MSTFWTPEGEHKIPPNTNKSSNEPSSVENEATKRTPPTEQELEAQMQQMREELGNTPASVIIENHCFGLFELAALHLSYNPPKLEEARLGIDALAALLEGMKNRLGEHETSLNEGLAQLRLAYVQIEAATKAGDQNQTKASE